MLELIRKYYVLEIICLIFLMAIFRNIIFLINDVYQILDLKDENKEFRRFFFDRMTHQSFVKIYILANFLSFSAFLIFRAKFLFLAMLIVIYIIYFT